MAVVQIDSNRISDWASFHSVCKEAFGFPEFYGENMDAFVDCLTYIDEGDGMSNIVLSKGEKLTIDLLNAELFRARLPEIHDALLESVAFINSRFTEDGKEPAIQLSFS